MKKRINSNTKYRMKIAYDGTDFAGWQSQPHEPTITGTLVDTFFACFNEKIHILGGSRTDAGVHARGQVATFSSSLELEPKKMKWVWNNALPPSIVIRSLEAVGQSFHPIAQAKEKTYHYYIFTKRPLPFYERYGWFYPQSFDQVQLEKSLHLFVGTHDFRSFCTGNEKENTVRTISYISVTYMKKIHAYRIVITGTGFLRHMVRRIVGACMESARGRITEKELFDALHTDKTAEHIFYTAPAKGLFLHAIEYKE